MSHAAGTISIPLLSLGLPARVSGWLLDAGIPCLPLDTAAVRRGIGPELPGRPIVLYDSRNASARTDAETATSLGYETIDAARLLTARANDDDPERTLISAADPRRRFLDRLPGAVEEAGGIWARLADFPHPYRWAVCGDPAASDRRDDNPFATVLSAFAELPAQSGELSRHRPAGHLSVDDLLRSCAMAGRPVRAEGDAFEAIEHSRIEMGRLPRAWVTTLDEFADWWRLRRRLSLRATRRDRFCEFELEAPPQFLSLGFRPAVEIWRGRHHAIVPLRPGLTIVRDDSLPFQMNVSRHHAGFTADAVDPDLAGLPERAVAFATA